jgi:hypothetical protein
MLPVGSASREGRSSLFEGPSRRILGQRFGRWCGRRREEVDTVVVRAVSTAEREPASTKEAKKRRNRRRNDVDGQNGLFPPLVLLVRRSVTPAATLPAVCRSIEARRWLPLHFLRVCEGRKGRKSQFHLFCPSVLPLAPSACRIQPSERLQSDRLHILLARSADVVLLLSSRVSSTSLRSFCSERCSVRSQHAVSALYNASAALVDLG